MLKLPGQNNFSTSTPFCQKYNTYLMVVHWKQAVLFSFLAWIALKSPKILFYKLSQQVWLNKLKFAKLYFVGYQGIIQCKSPEYEHQRMLVQLLYRVSWSREHIFFICLLRTFEFAFGDNISYGPILCLWLLITVTLSFLTSSYRWVNNSMRI